MAQDWEIRGKSDACAGCGRAFGDGNRFFSALTFGEQGYRRTDYCEPCWRTWEQCAGAYSSWQSVYRLPPPEPEEPLKQETAESLLRRLMEDEHSRLNVIFILAVMLERKKVLVERGVQEREDGALIRAYEHRRTGETFMIRDPRLRLDQLEDVQQEVVAMLGGPAGKGSGEPAPDGEPVCST